LVVAFFIWDRPNPNEFSSSIYLSLIISLGPTYVLIKKQSDFKINPRLSHLEQNGSLTFSHVPEGNNSSTYFFFFFFFLVTCLLVPEARKVSEAGDPTTTTLGRLLHAKLDSGYLLSHGKT
jgi:hypothetical protein